MIQDEKISVVIPAYNLAGYIENTLLSVLNQTVPPDEVVVVDDGSDDNTVEIVENISSTAPDGFIKLLRQKRSGPGAARNRGIQEAKGKWIAFLDGDDIWLADKIKHVREAICNTPGAVVITHDEFEVDYDGHEVLRKLHEYYNPALPLLPQLYRRCFFSTSCMTIRKDVLISTGGFDTTLPSSQDYDLWLKLAQFEKVFFIPIPLEKYVLRPFSISANVGKRLECTLLISRRYFPQLKHYLGTVRACIMFFIVVLIHYYIAVRSFHAQKHNLKAIGVLVEVPAAVVRALLYILPLCR